MSDKKCPNCGACKECGAHPGYVQPYPYTYPPSHYYQPWVQRWPYYNVTCGTNLTTVSGPAGTNWNVGGTAQ